MTSPTIPPDDLLLHLARASGLCEAMHRVSAENAKMLLRNFFIAALQSMDTSDVVDADFASHAEFADDWAVAVQAAAARGDIPMLAAGQRCPVETAPCVANDPDLPEIAPSNATFDDWLAELTENDKLEFLSQFWHSSQPRTDDALTIADYEEVLADHRRLVRELDVLLNGDKAARQASLVDIVAQFRGMKRAPVAWMTTYECPPSTTVRLLDAMNPRQIAYVMEGAKKIVELVPARTLKDDPPTVTRYKS